MSRNKIKAVHNRSANAAVCAHHWVIESPDGPLSRGICRLCGAEKEFTNYVPYLFWYDSKWKSRKALVPGTEMATTAESPVFRAPALSGHAI